MGAGFFSLGVDEDGEGKSSEKVGSLWVGSDGGDTAGRCRLEADGEDDAKDELMTRGPGGG